MKGDRDSLKGTDGSELRVGPCPIPSHRWPLPLPQAALRETEGGGPGKIKVGVGGRAEKRVRMSRTGVPAVTPSFCASISPRKKGAVTIQLTYSVPLKGTP